MYSLMVSDLAHIFRDDQSQTKHTVCIAKLHFNLKLAFSLGELLISRSELYGGYQSTPSFGGTNTETQDLFHFPEN